MQLRATRFLGWWSKGRESGRWGLARWSTEGECLLFRFLRKGRYSELLNRFIWFVKDFDAMCLNLVNLCIVVSVSGQEDGRDSKFKRTFRAFNIPRAISQQTRVVSTTTMVLGWSLCCMSHGATSLSLVSLMSCWTSLASVCWNKSPRWSGKKSGS